jgi:tetratricopeptide (TPR) repeat protein
MKTRDVVITVVLSNIVTIGVAIFIVNALRTSEPQVQKEQPVYIKEVLPAPTASVAADKPAVNKEAVFALLDAGRENRKKEAIKEFKKVMQDVPPYDTLIPATNGYRVAMDGDIAEAVKVTQKDIAQDPSRMEYRYTLAWIHAKVGDYDSALRECNEMLALGSEYLKMNYLLGWIYAKQGKYDDASKACDTALTAEPHSASLYYAKGRIEDLKGNTDKAVEFYTKTISLKNDFYTAYIFLGFLYTELGRNDEAVATFKQAIGLDRYKPAGYVGLGLVYDETNNYRAALKQYNDAITLGFVSVNVVTQNKSLLTTIGVDDAIIYNRIGILNIRLGDYQEARYAFSQAIEARQEFHESYRGLVLCNLLLGDKESAMKAYDEFKILDAEMAKSVAPFVKQN